VNEFYDLYCKTCGKNTGHILDETADLDVESVTLLLMGKCRHVFECVDCHTKHVTIQHSSDTVGIGALVDRKRELGIHNGY